MAHLKLDVLGSLRVMLGAKPIPTLESTKARALVRAYRPASSAYCAPAHRLHCPSTRRAAGSSFLYKIAGSRRFAA